MASTMMGVRTTLSIDDDLLDAAKRLALAERRTISSVVEEAMRAMLARREAVRDAEPFVLDTFDGGGYRPGVDIADNARLLDLMDAG